MSATAKQTVTQTANRRHLLLASDRGDQSSELARILRSVGDVDMMPTTEIPENPGNRFSGVIVDINLRSPESVQRVRKKLSSRAYSDVPRLFVLAEALHHATMQAWALGATDTIARPFSPADVLQRIRSALPADDGYDETDRGKLLNRGVEAAQAIMVKIFEKLPTGAHLTMEDIVAAENKILKAIKHSSLREWMTVVGCHHNDTYRHCLFVTGLAVGFSIHLGMRDDDQRRLVRAALLHDVGKAFIPVAILDKQGKLTAEEIALLRQHPRRGYEALWRQGGFPPEMLDVILHHHEFLDGSGYPDALHNEQISDIVRLTTIVDIYAALIEHRAYRPAFTHARAFQIMENMGPKLDQQLLQAFRPVAMGAH
ncbi:MULTISPECIES: HD-GYP domain-containing protein [unclassified Bradyrhizobium]|uniref:HD-GYP domain-containing protein n=1 Tax=Bradyrhizobium TaxID=374 RepID=UPI0028F0EDC1|nr:MULTISPECIES: HD domain-containing phosphohydrolase [unclassified Bradyrhizobium]